MDWFNQRCSLLTGKGYYGGSTVVPVVVPVFWSLLPTRYLTNFLYELKVGMCPYEKPESGRVCGSKGSPQVLLRPEVYRYLPRFFAFVLMRNTVFLHFFLCALHSTVVYRYLQRPVKPQRQNEIQLIDGP